MHTDTLSAGIVHDVPEDLRQLLVDDEAARALWEDITPIARNEWICWVEDAKKLETRHRRIARVRSDLKAGKRRPCCWPGCSHR
ncbi:YdeI/OmpD-associated family protein [Halomonas sp. THAF12]|uniref:YdeI/OmpD-associated family protein n=1 Tax=Halomonas sp. B23F22_10 TaxID=3459515 RepID=UPI00373F8C34